MNINRIKKIGFYKDKDSKISDYIGVIIVEKKDRKKRRIICRYHTGIEFDLLTDITGVDYPERDKRFDLVYNRLSRRYSTRRLIKVKVGENERMDTVTNIYKVAIWMEREIWDIFGIGFTGNKDLRRILTDYGFEGHPRRKDFPLSGYVEIRYDEEKKGVKVENVELSQGPKK